MHGRTSAELPAFQDRLDRQARVTRPLRLPLYERVGLSGDILDVGCGNGAVTQDLLAYGKVVAVDVDPAMVDKAKERLSIPVYLADGKRLPFADDCFDAAVLNLVLLWAEDPRGILRELRRVVKPGGVILASMEPDYGGKIHWPSNPFVDAVFQGDGVRRRGGDPQAGRKLRQWFTECGLITDVGISNAELPTTDQDLVNFQRNRTYYRNLLQEAGFPDHEIDAWEIETLDALERGIQLTFLPMFWASGHVPDDVLAS